MEEARNLKAAGQKGSIKAKMKYYCCAREFLIPMGILFALSCVQGSSGVDTLSYYSLKIFRHAKISLSPYFMSIFLQVRLRCSFHLNIALSKFSGIGKKSIVNVNQKLF